MPLADLLSCPADQVHEAVFTEEAYSIGAWYLAKNIANIELSMLGELIGAGPYDSLMDGFDLVGEPLPEGPWPQTIPVSLTDAIRSETDEQFAEVATAWAGIDEFGGHADPDDLARYLREVRAFLNDNPGPYFLVAAL